MNFSYPKMPESDDSQNQQILETDKSPAAEDNSVKQNFDEPEENLKGGIFTIAHIISWLSVPVLMPVYGILLIFHLSVLSLVPGRLKWIFTIIVIGLCTILPVVCGLVMKALGLIKDIGLNNRKERFYPYLATGVLFMVTGVYFLLRQAPMWCGMFFLGGGLAALINAVINRWWKISAHLAGVGGVVALLIVIALKGFPQYPMIPWIAGGIICAGLIGSSRLLLRRHTLGQVGAGFAVGFCCVLILSLLF